MKAHILICIIIAGAVLTALTSLIINNKKYYYAFDQKVELIEKPNTLLIKYNREVEKDKKEKNIKELSSGTIVKWHGSQIAEIISENEDSKKALKLKLLQLDETKSCIPFYMTKEGINKGITDEILIRFKTGTSIEEQKNFFKMFKAEVVKSTKIYKKIIVPKDKDALETANRYYETGLFEFAYPVFISYFKPYQHIPNDTYFNNQVACHNTGQAFTDNHTGTADADIDAPEVWDITRGSSNIVIAVLDQGVTSDHPDLPNNRQLRLAGSDFVSNDNDPSPVNNDNHGNACAGVIAATMDNSQGVAGIAPNCRIMPIRILGTGGGIGPWNIADAIEFAVDEGANILSNSWGNGSNDPNDEPVIVTAIQYAIDEGRVVVFAAGNNANHDINGNGFVAFPGNVNIPGVITVGASDRNDDQANYSPTDNLIDVVAPSNRSMPWQTIAGETYEMWTIDIPGNPGYNIWHGPWTPPALFEELPIIGTNNLAYTARFGGTSHSCPVVAGIAALMLSEDPSLTPIEVCDILLQTAEDVGGYDYVNGRCDEMGHGRVNAFNAVTAVNLQISGSQTLCNSEVYQITGLPANANVNFGLSQYPNTIASMSTSGNTVTLTRNTYGHGTVSLSATVSFGGCTYRLHNMDISVGTGKEIEGYYRDSEGQGSPMKLLTEGTNYVQANAPSHAIVFGEEWRSATWSLIGGRCSDWFEWEEPDGRIVIMVLSNGDEATFRLTGTNMPCGTEYLDYKFVAESSYWSYYTLSPNPATDAITISVDEEKLAEQKVEISPDQSISRIVVLDKTGTLQSDQKYGQGTKEININVSKLKKGLYIVKIYNGKEWKVEKFIKE